MEQPENRTRRIVKLGPEVGENCGVAKRRPKLLLLPYLTLPAKTRSPGILIAGGRRLIRPLKGSHNSRIVSGSLGFWGAGKGFGIRFYG